jgi:hypothetical protein
MTEMVARVLKHLMRRKMRDTRSVESSAYISAVATFLNDVFGNDKENYVFWQSTLKKELDKYFIDWNTTNWTASLNLKTQTVNVCALFRRLQKLGSLGILSHPRHAQTTPSLD